MTSRTAFRQQALAALIFVYSGSACHAGRKVILRRLRDDRDQSGLEKVHPPSRLSLFGLSKDVVSGTLSSSLRVETSASAVTGGSVGVTDVAAPPADDKWTADWLLRIFGTWNDQRKRPVIDLGNHLSLCCKINCLLQCSYRASATV